MKFAVTVGAFELTQFVHANIKYIQESFGADTDILVSDDVSQQSDAIKAICETEGVAYYRSAGRMHHFSGDMQAILNSISFARQVGADVAVKISQRFWVISPEVRRRAEEIFGNPSTVIALPGRPPPSQILGSKSFSAYPVLTDILFLRANDFDPHTLKVYYETRWKNGPKIWHCFCETTFADLVNSQYRDRHHIFQELTQNIPGQPQLFLRRYMATPQQFQKAAAKFGIGGYFQTGEWRNLERLYSPRPKV